ncbi:MAG: GDSL-type esterase/lipase family protein [Pirellulaceae bacterium]|nr:GDSL-type esterase/lipase family protein [Pirellulaceae bacterium]
MAVQFSQTLTRRVFGFADQRRFFSWVGVVLSGSAVSVCLLTFLSSAVVGQERNGQTTSNALLTPSDDLLRQASRERWSQDVERLRQLDDLETYPDNAVLFIGSSSIRLWDNIQEDLAPIIPIRRGFGGAKSVDLAVFSAELMQSHRYSALVVFVANDIAGEADKVGQDPEKVVAWLKEVWLVSRQHQPNAPLLLIEITPTASRRHVWEQQRELNHRLRNWTLQEPNVYFLPTAEYFLDAQDEVRHELFVEDRLHLNREGYRVWGSLIRRRLKELLPGNPASTGK